MKCPRCQRDCPSVASLSAHARAAHPEEALAVQIDGFTERRGADECWPWHGARHVNGYGQINGRRVGRLLLGLTEPGVEARHTCDTPECVNPAHLIPGSHQDNMDDRQARGRTARGMRNGKTKITPAIAEEIRRRRAVGESSRAIGAALGIGKTTVNGVR